MSIHQDSLGLFLEIPTLYYYILLPPGGQLTQLGPLKNCIGNRVVEKSLKYTKMLVHSQALSTKVNFLKSPIPSFPSTIGLTSAVAIHQKCRCIKIGTFDEIGKKKYGKKIPKCNFGITHCRELASNCRLTVFTFSYMEEEEY